MILTKMDKLLDCRIIHHNFYQHRSFRRVELEQADVAADGSNLGGLCGSGREEQQVYETPFPQNELRKIYGDVPSEPVPSQLTSLLHRLEGQQVQ